MRRTVVLANDLAVDVGKPEDHRKGGDDGRRSDDGSGGDSLGELVETERRRTLVD